MTEFEAYEALRIETAFSVSIGEQSITLLTGYLLIAFFIGNRLTLFQVSFVNVLFSLMFFSSSVTLVSSMESLKYFADRVVANGSDFPLMVMGANPFFAGIIAFLMYLGAIYFMWTVRHPKVE